MWYLNIQKLGSRIEPLRSQAKRLTIAAAIAPKTPTMPQGGEMGHQAPAKWDGLRPTWSSHMLVDG